MSGVKNEWKADINQEWEKTDTYVLIDIYQQEFGFDFQTAVMLGNIYLKMEQVYGKDAPQKFFAIMGGYNYVAGAAGGDKGKGFLWNVVADVGRSTEQIDRELINLGFAKEEVSALKQSIRDQYRFCQYISIEDHMNQSLDPGTKLSDLGEYQHTYVWAAEHYSNKSDFSHMCIIIATVLNSGSVGQYVGNLAGYYNGIFDIEKNAGYVGDIYGTAGVNAKITPDDYKADLDAVNVAKRIEENGYTGVNDIIKDYFTQLNNEEISREYEFAYNIGGNNVDVGIARLKWEFPYVAAWKEHVEVNIEEDKKYNPSTAAQFIHQVEMGVEQFESKEERK